MTVRRATARDQAAVLALIEQLFQPPGARPGGYSRRRGREGFFAAVGDPDADVLLAVEGDAVVGLASVYMELPLIRFGRRCWLQDLVVTSARRSEGIGARLLDAATEWARERGCTHLQLDSGFGRKDAHRFYLAQGMSGDSASFTRHIRT